VGCAWIAACACNVAMCIAAASIAQDKVLKVIRQVRPLYMCGVFCTVDSAQQKQKTL
jgi:hypothetical protein